MTKIFVYERQSPEVETYSTVIQRALGGLGLNLPLENAILIRTVKHIGRGNFEISDFLKDCIENGYDRTEENNWGDYLSASDVKELVRLGYSSKDLIWAENVRTAEDISYGNSPFCDLNFALLVLDPSNYNDILNKNLIHAQKDVDLRRGALLGVALIDTFSEGRTNREDLNINLSTTNLNEALENIKGAGYFCM